MWSYMRKIPWFHGNSKTLTCHVKPGSFHTLLRSCNCETFSLNTIVISGCLLKKIANSTAVNAVFHLNLKLWCIKWCVCTLNICVCSLLMSHYECKLSSFCHSHFSHFSVTSHFTYVPNTSNAIIIMYVLGIQLQKQ